MSTFEDFLPEVKLRAYGVSDPVAIMYTRAAIIDFCERTKLWTRLVQEYAVQGDGRIYLTQLDENNETLESVVPGTYGSIRVFISPPDEVAPYKDAFAGLNFAGWPTGAPQVIFQLDKEEGDVVGVYPVPDKTYADIPLTLVLKPSPTSTVFPDFLLTHYRETIVEGTLARIHMVPGQVFTNPSLAADEVLRFAQGKVRGEVDARRGRTAQGELQVAMRPFARGRR